MLKQSRMSDKELKHALNLVGQAGYVISQANKAAANTLTEAVQHEPHVESGGVVNQSQMSDNELNNALNLVGQAGYVISQAKNTM